ncbi:hypothetical protein [Leuconostoc lactis]|uniref:hypothetical protein n=1 Tax=Leuconostoc lactis TaxID=1246 RepID=UPI001FCA8AAF|nr:hypothetical protein [Leuconostoc lactis]
MLNNEKNQGYLKDVQQAETTKQLEDVVHRMIEGGADFDFRVDVEKSCKILNTINVIG